MPTKKKDIPPYYKRRPNESLFFFFRRLIKSIIAMYPHARKHGIRYYFDTEYRRNLSYGRGKKLRTKREGKLSNPTVKKRVKMLLAERDGRRCNHCKQEFGLNSLTIDHIVRLVKNGSNELPNLQLLCTDCHQVKTAEEHRAEAKQNGRNLWDFER
jgi:5-methylcytosine-specific restriction protein A